MRVKLGRPRIGAYRSRFDLPAADGDVSVTFAGVSTLLFDDGESSVLTDGFFSRPGLAQVGLGALTPHAGRISSAMSRLAIGDRLLAITPVHTHFDHAMDSGVVAQRSGATLVGGGSAANVGRGQGLPPSQIDTVATGESRTYGRFALTWIASRHCPPDRFPGVIAEPVRPPVRAAAYKCGEAWSLLVEHAGGRTALVQGSAGYVAGALSGRRAEVAYLGVGQLGVQDPGYIDAYWSETVRAVGARRVVLVHWDDFFRSLDRPLRALPYAGDDLDATMRILGRLADDDGVTLHFPTPWRPEDPWAGMPAR